MSQMGVLELGRQVGPFPGCLDGDLIRRYGEATGDSSPEVGAGIVVPPAAIVTQIWDAQTAGREVLLDREFAARSTGGVHGAHDIVLHRPVVVGEPLQTWVRGHGARMAGRNCAVTLRYVTVDAAGALVAEQWWTTMLFGVDCEAVGEPAPDHAFPPEARDRPVAVVELEVDADMARRYAEVSGDWSPHHFDLEAARRSGFDRLFLHGLCTMGLCARGIVGAVVGGDPSRVRRLAVRFSSPTFLGEQVSLAVFAGGPGTFAFEATSNGRTVISHGRVELR